MPMQIMKTKLFCPPFQSTTISRPRLVKQLDEGLKAKLTLISASAGFGKTVLLSEWINKSSIPVAWISLDLELSDEVLFMTYVGQAINNITHSISDQTFKCLQSQKGMESFLISLINDMTTVTEKFVLVLDDYHFIENTKIDEYVLFLVNNAPPVMRIVISTREDPNLNLSKLRANNQLSEIRMNQLRFSISETTEFLNEMMKLDLEESDVIALDTRTEGWIAGLRLAGISMNQRKDIGGFIKNFSGSHRYVLSYLIEEVFDKMSEHTQNFLIKTSILDRFCGPLCDAVMSDQEVPGEETLQYLERINLFVVPLDEERHWYRYHHLFAELLKQRLIQKSTEIEEIDVSLLHKRASQWLEEQGLLIEAFAHTTAAGDIKGAERLIEGKGMPLQFLGALNQIIRWLESLPKKILNQNPTLWVTFASVVLGTGQTIGIEDKLQTAEKLLESYDEDETTKDIRGQIASTRASLALTKHDSEGIIFECQKALELLSSENSHYRVGTYWTLGYAYQLRGERKEARSTYTEAIKISQMSGNIVIYILASMGLGQIQELDNEYVLAEKTFLQILEMVGKIPLTVAVCLAHLGLARIYYQWNELEKAAEHIEVSIENAHLLVNTDIIVTCNVVKAYILMANSQLDEANAILSKAEVLVENNDFILRIPEIVDVHVILKLRQNQIEDAYVLANKKVVDISMARVWIAKGEIDDAIELLEKLQLEYVTKHINNELIKVQVLLSLCYKETGDIQKSTQLMCQLMTKLASEKFVRLYLDIGTSMIELIYQVRKLGVVNDYIEEILGSFRKNNQAKLKKTRMLVEPLSIRELEILELINQGLTNKEIGDQLFIALDTVKGHNRRIFGKLEVKTRIEAIKKANLLGIIDS